MTSLNHKILLLSVGNRFSYFPTTFRDKQLPMDPRDKNDTRSEKSSAKDELRCRFAYAYAKGHAQVRAHEFAGVNASSNN